MQRRFRLCHERDFARLRREGHAYQNRHLLISVMPNGLLHNRYGFITSKQLGNAVTRNRVRRLLREVMRQFHPRLQIGNDFVLVARRGLVGQPFRMVERIVEEICNQTGLLVTGNDEA